jgi:hypothetical protein
MKHLIIRFLAVASLAFCVCLPVPAQDRNSALRTVESYLKRVLVTNSAHAPIPMPNDAEQAALAMLKARVTENEVLKLDRLPAQPLADIRSVNDFNVIMKQLRHPEPYLKKAADDAREAERRAQIAELKQETERAPPALTLSKETRERMTAFGITLNAKNQIFAGGQVFDPMTADAAAILEAASTPAEQIPETAKTASGQDSQAARLKRMREVLEEIRKKAEQLQRTVH